MLEDEEINKYVASMNKIIASGNPKYLSYVCKEYMTCKKNNPVLAMILENMIKKEADETGSVYAILIDNDNSINLDAMSDISKITNTADFIKKVDALADQEVDFGDLTSDELIIEGMEIAEELAKEIENLENNIDYENESQAQNIESEINSKTENALGKITLFGAVAVSIKSIVNNIKNRASSAKSGLIERIKNKRARRKQRKEEEKLKAQEDKKTSVKNEVKEDKIGNIEKLDILVKQDKLEKNNNFIPKVTIDEKNVIKQMNENKTNKKNNKVSEKGITNTADDDFNDTSDDDNNDNNGSPEDDEPDI